MVWVCTTFLWGHSFRRNALKHFGRRKEWQGCKRDVDVRDRDEIETFDFQSETRQRPKSSHFSRDRDRDRDVWRSVRDETETFPHFTETETRLRRWENASRDRLETETSRPRLHPWSDFLLVSSSQRFGLSSASIDFISRKLCWSALPRAVDALPPTAESYYNMLKLKLS